MRLANIIEQALRPHIDELKDWNKSDFEYLFIGFGNIIVRNPAGLEFTQTFWKNAVDICLALDELGFGELEFVEKDLYYMIHATPGQIRKDLAAALQKDGNTIRCVPVADAAEAKISFGDDFVMSENHEVELRFHEVDEIYKRLRI